MGEHLGLQFLVALGWIKHKALVLPLIFKCKSPVRIRHMSVVGINWEQKFTLSRWRSCKA